MEKNVYSRNPDLVAPGQPMYPLGEPTVIPTRGTPIVPTQTVATSIGTTANNINNPMSTLSFEQPLEIPAAPIKGSIGVVSHVINNNTPTDILMGDTKHPTAAPVTGGVKAPATTAAPAANNTFPKNYKILRDCDVHDGSVNTGMLGGIANPVTRRLKAGDIVTIVKDGGGGNGIVMTPYLFLNDKEFIIAYNAERTDKDATISTKTALETERENYKKWFVLTGVVLGIIILIRVFK